MSDKPMRIGIVVGEVSGDILGSGLLAELKKQYPNAVFEGIGGANMIKQGFNSLFDMEELSVMGLVEVLSRIRRLFQIRAQLTEYFTQNPPDVFIGIDAPDFNLGLETKLKKRGIKTVHYVSPTIWAWRENRVHKIKKAADLVLCLFPFEPEIYHKYQMKAEFIGHTMADQIPLQVDRNAARDELNIAHDEPVLALLPGSRGGEVAKLLDIFMQTAEKLSQSVPGLHVLVPVVNAQRKQQIDDYLVDKAFSFKLTLLDGQAREAMIASNAVLLASGTATLEAMLCKRPMVVAYKLAPMTHWMMGYLYKQNYFSLPNILAGREVVPELLQEDVNPDTLCQYLLPKMQSENVNLIDTFTQLHETLKRDADKQAAIAVQSLIAKGK
ncbi:lipid-A-disaccharide synthase [Paraneptunicella aestuarii]|uniref:lipid-A-disaccharide synthase n=1 Tax=Paraneptunicella aestuarii TaxID=2831148 RepID=UPI001E53BD30|nr:lipid-A-disaccharide synthase [Paraneptunicella aestuarii]UAA39718.1 lipid-A-disaccharide synthase [Paraneptunicella aestuarii]